MKIRTQDLNGLQLSWAVAGALGYLAADGLIPPRVRSIRGVLRDTAGDRGGYTPTWCPHDDWEQGGEIIDSEGITVGPWDTSPAAAHYGTPGQINGDNPRMVGPTKLVAAMRALVWRHLGPEVDVPEELL